MRVEAEQGVRRSSLREVALALVRALAIVALAILALWACGPITIPPSYFAPTTMMQPVVAPNFRQSRGGVSLSAMQPESANGIGLSSVQGTTWSGSAFFAQRISTSRFEVGALAFGGPAQSFGIGPQMRMRFIDGDYVWFGLDASIGFLFLQAGLPLGIQLSKNLWLYTDPTVMLAGLYPGARIPVGLAIATDYFIIGAEVGYNRLFGSNASCTQADQSLCSLGFFYGGLSFTARSDPKAPVETEESQPPAPVYEPPPEIAPPPDSDAPVAPNPSAY